jgi:calcineurin-like phosphoesterase family protein
MPAEPRSTFFTSDTHFGDHRVLNIRRRPFSSVAEMNEALIAAWNARVGPADEIWHLGDFASGHTVARAVLPRLNGRKHLVIGNLDGPEVCALGWSSVQAYAEISLSGTLVVMCHYPFRTWNGQHRGSINLHGHSHGRLAPLKRQRDVGVDGNEYQPISSAEVLATR